MSIDLDALETLARAATPGPWWCEELDEVGDTIGILTVKTPCEVLAVMSDTQAPIDNADNAEFIAAASPDVVLGLIERLRAYRQALWDIYAILGADTDGDTTPDAVDGDLIALVVEMAQEFRADYDQALAEVDLRV